MSQLPQICQKGKEKEKNYIFGINSTHAFSEKITHVFNTLCQ